MYLFSLTKSYNYIFCHVRSIVDCCAIWYAYEACNCRSIRKLLLFYMPRKWSRIAWLNKKKLWLCSPTGNWGTSPPWGKGSMKRVGRGRSKRAMKNTESERVKQNYGLWKRRWKGYFNFNLGDSRPMEAC